MSEIQKLLDAERRAPPAPDDAKARVLEAVRATIAVPPPPSGGASVPPASGAAAAKIAGVFLAGAIAGGVTHSILQKTETVVIEVPVPVEVVREVIVEKVIPPAPLAEPPPRGRSKPPPKSDLSLERVLLERARNALARRNVASALDALGDHRARFPLGKLREERLALEVQALVSAQRKDEAQARASELARDFPKSMFLPVVDAALRD